jgi:hypothetical protein
VEKITPTKLQKDKYKTAHHDFFNKMFAKGFGNAQTRIKAYALAAFAHNKAEIDATDFDTEIKAALTEVSEGNGGYCTVPYTI